MLAALAGITNRTNWKEQKQQQRNFSITLQDSERLNKTHREDAKTLCALSFLRIVRKGKRKYKDKAGKTRQDKRTSRGRKTENWQRDKRTKSKAKRQNERQTRHKPQNRLTPHAHKSHTSHAKHQDNTNPHQTPKTL